MATTYGGKKRSVAGKVSDTVTKAVTATGNALTSGLRQPTNEQRKEADLARISSVKGVHQTAATQETAATPEDGKKHSTVIFNKDGTVTVDNNLNDDTPAQTVSKEVYNADLKKQAAEFGKGGKATGGVSAEAVNSINPEVEAARQQQQLLSSVPNASPGIGADAAPPGFDLLDTGKILGGAIGGATAGAGLGAAVGSVVPGAGTVVGGAIGGIIGGIGGGALAFYQSQSSERVQATKAGYVRFTGATSNMENIINSVNAGRMTPQAARIAWETEYQLALQGQREVKQAGNGLFGSKLAKNQDERMKIETWLRLYPYFNIQFQQALMQPNPMTQTSGIAVPNVPEVQQ